MVITSLAVARSLSFYGMQNPLGIRQQTVGAISETFSGQLSAFDDSVLSKYGLDAATYRLGNYGLGSTCSPWIVNGPDA